MRKSILLTTAVVAGIRGFASFAGETAAASPAGAPRIQFETNFFDFGKITAIETMPGVFRFKNAGEGVLKVETPESTCDCTVATVKPETLAPGESGEINFNLILDHEISGRRLIKVHSNDPATPEVLLTVQMDYTPLLRLVPGRLQMFLPAGKDEAANHFTVHRVDGAPLGIDRVTTSEKWLEASIDPAQKPGEDFARVNVVLHRPPGPPAPFNATVRMWSTNYPLWPVRTMKISGEAFGEVSAVPARFYWAIPDLGKNRKDYPEEALTKTIELTSVLGHEVEITRVTSDIKGLGLRVVPKGDRKRYSLILSFDEVPHTFTNGKVTVETSLASLPKLEIPVILSVPDGQ